MVLNFTCFRFEDQDSVSPSLGDVLNRLEQMVSNSETNLKNCFAAGTETLPVETTAGVIVTFIYITRLVAELFSNVDSKAKFDLLLAPGSFFLPNMTRVWLYNRAVAARG